MEVQKVERSISRQELAEIAKGYFGGELAKAVVDVRREVMAVGGEMHADEEKFLLEDGSQQKDLWGINLYPTKSDNEWIEFNSMINIRPSQGNHSRGVEDAAVQKEIIRIVNKLVNT